ncbi:MAG: hypothetical protein NTW19_00315 [Planctomycetota bacterium]|nr:hypothetical protein [Planctomycetota bacterium]
MNNAPSLADWIAHVFDHPVGDPAWHWSFDAPNWHGSAEETSVFIAETFEQSGELLAGFTDAQLNQGLWYLVSGACSHFMRDLVEPKVPLPIRLRALRSFLPLFEQVMAVRCSPHLSALDEGPSNPLNATCCMWWDILPIMGTIGEPERHEFDAEVMSLFPRLLDIAHDACRESALHGLGHWHLYYPNLESVVDEFLARATGLRSELVHYAKCARNGMVL